MSELPPENRPGTFENLDDIAFDSAALLRHAGEGAARVSQFLRTEIGAFDVLQRITKIQNETVGELRVDTDAQGTWRIARLVDYNPDPADSRKRRGIGILFRTDYRGTLPQLVVIKSPVEAPVETYERQELPIALAALKGVVKDSSVVPILIGPPSEAQKRLLNTQQRYARWVARAAEAVGISGFERATFFAPKDRPSLN